MSHTIKTDFGFDVTKVAHALKSFTAPICPSPFHTENGLESEEQLSIAVLVAVTSEEQGLSACLSSVADHVDEIVIVDLTRSHQVARSTQAFVPEVVLEHPAETIPQALNQALAQVKSQWVLVLDANERLEKQDVSHLLTHCCDDSVDFYSVAVRRYVKRLDERTYEQCATPNQNHLDEALNEFPAYIQSTECRLLQRRAVGEFLETAGDGFEIALNTKAGRECRSSFRIHRVPQTSERSIALRKRSGEARIAGDPNDAMAHFRLGLLEYESDDYVSALNRFRDACISNAQLGASWLYMGSCLTKLGAHRRAVEACLRAEMCGLHVPMIAETMGDALYMLSDFAAAKASYLRAYKRAQKMQPHHAEAINRMVLMSELRLSGSTDSLAEQVLAADRKVRSLERQKKTTQSVEVVDLALEGTHLLTK